MNNFVAYANKIIIVFLNDFTVYSDSFDKYLEYLSLVLKRRIETNLILNDEKCYFIVDQGIVFTHVMSLRGLKIDQNKIDVI